MHRDLSTLAVSKRLVSSRICRMKPKPLYFSRCHEGPSLSAVTRSFHFDTKVSAVKLRFGHDALAEDTAQTATRRAARTRRVRVAMDYSVRLIITLNRGCST